MKHMREKRILQAKNGLLFMKLSGNVLFFLYLCKLFKKECS